MDSHPTKKISISNNDLIGLDSRFQSIIKFGNFLTHVFNDVIASFYDRNQHHIDSFRERIRVINHNYFVMENHNTVMLKKRDGVKQPVLQPGRKLSDYKKEMDELHKEMIEIEIGRIPEAVIHDVPEEEAQPTKLTKA